MKTHLVQAAPELRIGRGNDRFTEVQGRRAHPAPLVPVGEPPCRPPHVASFPEKAVEMRARQRRYRFGISRAPEIGAGLGLLHMLRVVVARHEDRHTCLVVEPYRKASNCKGCWWTSSERWHHSTLESRARRRPPLSDATALARPKNTQPRASPSPDNNSPKIIW